MSRLRTQTGLIRDWLQDEYEIDYGVGRRRQYYIHADVDGLPAPWLCSLHMAAFGIRCLDLLREHGSANGGVVLGTSWGGVHVSLSSKSSRGLLVASMHGTLVDAGKIPVIVDVSP